MSKLDWSSPNSAMAHVIDRLKKNPKGLTENALNTRHDPTLVTRALDMLQTRKVVELCIDESKVGPERKIYKLKG